MTAHIFDEYSVAQKSLTEASTKAQKLIGDMHSTLSLIKNNWQSVSFSYTTENGFKQGSSSNDFNLDTQPTLRQVSDALEAYHQARHNMNSIVQRLTADQRVTLNLPSTFSA